MKILNLSHKYFTPLQDVIQIKLNSENKFNVSNIIKSLPKLYEKEGMPLQGKITENVKPKN